MTQRVKFTGLIVGVFSLSFLLFGIGTPRILGSVQESDRARNSSGFGFRANRGTVAVVAVGMWKLAFGAGFQAPWDGQQIFGKDCHRSHGASFPQRTRNSAHFGANVAFGRCAMPKSLFSESRVECVFIHIILAQSHFLYSTNTPT